MFPTSDNPADRLLEILSVAKNQQENAVVIHVFGNIFNYPANDKLSFYRVVAYLNELVDQIEVRVRAIPDINHSLHLRDLPAIRSVVCPNGANDTWAHYSNPLKFGALTSLEFCADALKKVHKEVPISEQQFTDLETRIDALYKSVSDSDLEPDLKAVIFDLLGTIRLSLDYYRVKGAEGIKKAVTYCAGLMALHGSRFKGKKDDITVKGGVELVGKVVEVVNGAYKLKELAPCVIDFFRLHA